MTIDQEKLRRLQQKYAGDKIGKIFDPQFERTAELIASQPRSTVLPYSGVATLLDAPSAETAEGLDVALIGVPMDLGVTNRAGARFGPRALRNVDRIGPYHHVLEAVPFSEMKCADIGDVLFTAGFDLDSGLRDIEAFYREVIAHGAAPLTAGGDHSITYPILKAVGHREPVGLVHIDAHCDTTGVYHGSKFHHGGPFRNAVLDGVLDPDRTLQIGIRGSAEYLWEFSYESGMTVIHVDEFDRLGVAGVIEKCREVLGDRSFYISIDVDGIDPCFTPGTGTPEVGGLMPREVQSLLWGLKGLDVVGGDVVEVAPEYDATTNTAQIGAQLMFEIASLLQFSPSLVRR